MAKVGRFASTVIQLVIFFLFRMVYDYLPDLPFMTQETRNFVFAYIAGGLSLAFTFSRAHQKFIEKIVKL